MSSWNLNNPPVWFPTAVATERGWENPVTGEVLVAIRGLNTKAGAPDVLRIVNVSAKSLLKATDKISLKAYFSEKVVVTGTPRIILTVNGVTKYAAYVSGSGTGQLLFEWTVTNENATAGQVVMAETVYGAAIDLNGGTIRDAASNNVLGLDDIAVADLSGIAIDTTAPTITATAITGGTAGGTTMIVTLTTSTPVYITPANALASGLVLNINATPVTASYVSGSGTTSLVYHYTIANGLKCTAGQFSTGVLTLTAADLAGNALDVTVPAAPTEGTIAITDPIAPTIRALTVPAAGSYKDADSWTFKVKFSEVVNVTGTPRLSVDIGANNRKINYTTGTGTDELTFPYTVVGGDTATAGTVIVQALELNSGTIKDASLNAAILTFATPDTSRVIVDNVHPTVVSFGKMTGTYVSGSLITIPVVFSENVTFDTGSGTPYIGMTISGVSRRAGYAGMQSPNTALFTYLVVPADEAVPGQFVIVSPIVLNGGTILDAAGNAAVLSFTPPSTTDVVVI